MTEILDYRRYRTSDAARVLHQLGAPRSAFRLRKDHMQPPGQSGPPFVRDERGHCWYWHTALDTWAAAERSKLSADNPAPAAVWRERRA